MIEKLCQDRLIVVCSDAEEWPRMDTLSYTCMPDGIGPCDCRSNYSPRHFQGVFHKNCSRESATVRGHGANLTGKTLNTRRSG